MEDLNPDLFDEKFEDDFEDSIEELDFEEEDLDELENLLVSDCICEDECLCEA